MQQDLATQVKLCSELLELRDTLAKALGDKYAASVAIPKMLIIAVTERTKVATLEAAMELAGKCVEDGHPHTGSLILASAVELLIAEGERTMRRKEPTMG